MVCLPVSLPSQLNDFSDEAKGQYWGITVINTAGRPANLSLFF